MFRHFMAALLAVSIASMAQAQGTQIALGGLNADPDAPVEITAQSLNVDQDNGTAVFVGDVVIGQGDMRIAAARVQVHYSEATGDIAKLMATGGVTLVTGSEAAEAAQAEYDLDAGSLTLSGNVLLTQGSSAISADTMQVDLSDGTAQMQGRVRTVFSQGNN